MSSSEMQLKLLQGSGRRLRTLGAITFNNLQGDCSGFSVGAMNIYDLTGIDMLSEDISRLLGFGLLQRFVSSVEVECGRIGHNKLVVTHHPDSAYEYMFSILQKYGTKRTLKTTGWTGLDFRMTVLSLPKKHHKPDIPPAIQRMYKLMEKHNLVFCMRCIDASSGITYDVHFPKAIEQ